MYKFVVCVDPDTAVVYSINLHNYELHIEQFPDEETGSRVNQKARKACEQLRQIISWGNFKKLETDEVWKYRRRCLPTYLLQQSKLRLPAYIIEQPLPPSLSEQLDDQNEKGESLRRYRADIDIEVHLDEYYAYMRNKYSQLPRIPQTFLCKFKLVTSVNEVMKVIIKSTFQQREVELTTKNSKYKFVLQVMGNEDYLYGHTPLMNYLYIRRCLRNKEPAKLVLTQRIIQDNGLVRKCMVERQRSDVDKGIYKELDWDELLKDEFVLWYPPYALTEAAIKDIKTREALLVQYEEEKDKTAKIRKENPFFKNQQMENIRVKLKLLRPPAIEKPRFMLKEQALKMVEIRKTEIDKRIITIGQTINYSGECEYTFIFKVLGLTNALKMFKSNPKYNPTNTFQQASNSFTSQNEFNSTIFNSLKKLDLVPFVPSSIVIKTCITHGDRVLHESSTPPTALSTAPTFTHEVAWKKLSFLPLESKLFFTIIVFSKDPKNTSSHEIGCAGVSIFDEKGHLRQGPMELIVWPYKSVDLRIAGCINTCNLVFKSKYDYTFLTVKFPKYTCPIQWSLRSEDIIKSIGVMDFDMSSPKLEKETSKDIAHLEQLLRYDALRMMTYTDKDKELLKSCYTNYSKLPDKYINYLYSIDWSSPDDIKKAIRSREEWETLKTVDCIPLLSHKIVDDAIRFYAVQKMNSMTDDEIILFILQLVQSLASEGMHHNPLSEFLMERSAMSPHRVGHSFFWQLRSQLGKAFEFERYALYLECLMMLSKHRKDFCQQLQVNRVLTDTSAQVVKEQSNIEAKNAFFKNKLLPKLKGQLPSPFVLAINPEKKNDGFLASQCKVFDSKKVPLLLTLTQEPKGYFETEASSPKKGSTSNKQKDLVVLQRVIFKSGDDIRQDQLTLQVLKIMDNIWLEAGYDFKMSIYRVLSVDDMIGYIEVVENAENNSSIHRDHGGSMGALNNQTFELYLRKHNTTRQDYRNAKDNFIRSNVGYLVASYVLGLGDRHSGNAMITKNGMFFHIDFGHFLGNFKQKLKVKRQRTPFLFTSQFVHVMGGRSSKTFEQFEELCGIAYNLIRKNANLIINMFVMMVAAGIPQLSEYSHIDYLVDKLSLELSAKEAIAKIKKQIKDTLDNETSRRLDNLVHEIARNG